ncbi:hypothetical protein GXW74_08770 [Roseomonas eburnea]|uniref:Prepilin type IV endopeptidase peptidase domain-containing protein n=1 Tax=Neoroseomonas eburnea TaxID=1346889 RepID=A0A9X9XA41_9PROT|nr:prepilin peptidase [Neoroseomonas eburnea]MBR0680577.1 hypothetical protein [Neoroseomonas eburnea]
MVPFPASSLPEAIAWLALPGLALAALHDVAVRRIPNAHIAAVALIGLLRQAVSGGPMLALGLLAAGAVLLLAGALWLRGLMGGGDVKLLAAAALLVPAGQVVALLLAVALAGGLLCLLLLLLRAVLPRRGALQGSSGVLRRVLRCEAWRIGRGAPLPYGVAIAAGAAFLVIAPGR